MDFRTTLRVLTLAIVCGMSTPNPAPQYNPPPQYYTAPFAGQPSYSNVHQEPHYSGPQSWSQSNFSNPNANFLNPVHSPNADDIFRNIPRQAYGVPPSPASAYPQIYKVDNLIIIANPVQNQPQPCISQKPPPQFPNIGGDSEDLLNKFGEEPTNCTWAIVTCCSPKENTVRYNCFELLGCPGLFFGPSPCDKNTVLAATRAALEYYSTSSNGTNTNRV